MVSATRETAPSRSQWRTGSGLESSDAGHAINKWGDGGRAAAAGHPDGVLCESKDFVPRVRASADVTSTRPVATTFEARRGWHWRDG